MSGEKHGTVYIACDPDVDGRPSWSGYWDASPEDPPSVLEQGGPWYSPEEAVAWGRARAGVVLIRLTEPGGYWWAGEAEPPPTERFARGPDGRPGLEGIYDPGAPPRSTD